MKWLRTLILFEKGNVINSADWATVHDSYVRSIASVHHPLGSGALTLRRKMRLPNGQWQRNGVGFLRSHFLRHMQEVEKWEAEGGVDLGRDRVQPPIKLYPSLEDYRESITSDFGGFDFITAGAGGYRVAIEWETGNISSSHRSMNKLAIALAHGILQIGVLILPSRLLYEHLTDRIGNIGELSGYLAMWEGLKATVDTGLLAITVVEHDHLTDDPALPYLPMGNDGRAKEGRAKI
ncbi:hypothetical protein ACI7BZ_01695 [Xanthobacter sp. AM11]|uniref:hypothetical protein n=1 Tax=Xanthobacter sp. AM11 TaxID=3380643 RepID=UPI0039BFDE01